jgi:hypothetical protein
MTEFFWGFLGSVAGAVIGVPVLAYLSKTVVNHWLTRQLEQFKDQLQRDRDTSLEELRTNLRVLAYQRETRFARWHDRQASVLAELYSHLLRSETALRPSLPTFEIASVDEAWKAREALRIYFEENAVFIPAQIESSIEQVLNPLSHILLRISGSEITADEKERITEIVGVDFPRLREGIRRQVRAILIDETTGMSNSTTPQ